MFDDAAESQPRIKEQEQLSMSFGCLDPCLGLVEMCLWNIKGEWEDIIRAATWVHLLYCIYLL